MRDDTKNGCVADYKFTGKWKVRVPSHASVSKYHANKKLSKFVVYLVTSIKPTVLGFKRTKMFVPFLATFHLKDFREK